MCQNFEDSWVHASERRKQNIDCIFDERKDKKAVESACYLEDSSLCDRNCARNSFRRKVEVSRILRPIRELDKGRRKHEQRLQCDTGRSQLLRLPDLQLATRKRDRNTLGWLIRAEWSHDKGLIWHLKILPVLSEWLAVLKQRLSLFTRVEGWFGGLHKGGYAE